MGIKYNPKKRKYYDSLMNYIMTMVPREHEISLMKFVDQAIIEAYENGKHLNNGKYNGSKKSSSNQWR